VGISVYVTGTPSGGRVTRHDATRIAHALREPLARMQWGADAFIAPTADGDTWSVSTSIQQDDVDAMARDAMQVLALAVLASRAQPRWTFEVTEDVAFLSTQVGGDLVLRDGQLGDVRSQQQLERLLKPMLTAPAPVRRRRRAMVDVAPAAPATTWSAEREREASSVSQVSLIADAVPSQPATLVRCDVRQLRAGPDGSTPFVIDADVQVGAVPMERMHLRLLILDRDGAPMAELSLTHGVAGGAVEAGELLDLAEQQIAVDASPGVTMGGVQAWLGVQETVEVPVLHTWWWRTKDQSHWHVAFEVQAPTARDDVAIEVDWYDRNGRSLRTESFQRRVPEGRQLLTGEGEMHAVLGRAEGPVRVRATATVSHWYACELTEAG
jgi:hypothetical protein